MRESNTQPRRSRRRHNTTYCCSPMSARRRRRSAASPPRSAAPAGSRSCPRRSRRRSGRGSRTRCWSSRDRPGSRTSGLRPSRTACRATPCGTARTGRRGSSASRWSSTGSRAAATSTPSSSRTGFDDPERRGCRPRPDRARRSGAPPAAGPAGSRCRRSSGSPPRRGMGGRPPRCSARPVRGPARPAERARACGCCRRSGRGSGRAAGGSRSASRSAGSRSRDGRVVAVELEAATRIHRITHRRASCSRPAASRAAGWSATLDGRLVEPLLGPAGRGPARDDWLRREALDPAGHPIESAGIRTDATLRPLDVGRPDARQRRWSPARSSPASAPSRAMRRRRRGRVRAGAPPRRS